MKKMPERSASIDNPSSKKTLRSVMFRALFICMLAGLQVNAFSQDSSHIRISLLTCSPGEELYSTFGHTAIRVTDSSSLSDLVFNYGTFRFDDPNFYVKFIRGKLLYYVSFERFSDFRDAYLAENRGITEQVLNLDATGKIALMEALRENSKEENKNYKYDFFLDNCTTRARDMLVKYNKAPPDFKPVMPVGTRFRQAIHQYLDNNEKYWSKLGIDILLGARTDAVMTTGQSQFLPDNLMKSFDSVHPTHQLVLSKADLYQLEQEKSSGALFTPMLIFSLLFVLILLLGFFNNSRIKNLLQGFDGILFFLTGLMGILLIFMWVGTDHSMTKNNYNLLWAWPVNVVMAFFINSKKRWARLYFGFHAAALVLVLLCWFFLPQQLNNSLIPITLLLILRSGYQYLTRPS